MTRPRDQGLDGPIAALAERQHGVLSLGQLRELGFGGSGIERRLRRGALHPVHRGVYAVGHRRLSAEGRWMAAVLAAGPKAALSHRSAGQLLGLLSRTRSRPEITRPRSFRQRHGIVAHQAAVSPDEVEVVDGIPVTSVSRTLLDLAAVLSRRGAAALRAVLDEDGGGITRLELERRFAALIDTHRLPRPRRNAHVAVRGRFFEVDCLWDRARLVVELDGRAVHGTKRAFEADRERDRLLLGDGWGVVRLTWRQVRDEAPRIASELRSLLQNRPASAPNRSAPTL